jgi:hypothetical protein
MKKIIIICIGLFCFSISWAQIIVTSSQGNNITFKLSAPTPFAPLFKKGDLVSQASPRSSFIFETGDGYYYTTADTNHTYIPKAQPYKTVLSLSGRYDTVKPPPVLDMAITVSGSGSSATTTLPPLLLSTNELIRLTPIAAELTTNDEMLYILTYRVPKGATNAKIVFFYNHTNFDVFTPIALTSTIGTTQIPRVRTYFNELWPVANDNNLAATVNNIAPANGLQSQYNYPLNLSWIWNPSGSRKYDEHNIFITLPTRANLTDRTFGYVEAALLYHLNKEKIDTANNGSKENPEKAIDTSYNNRQVSSVYSSISAYPHDPNFIRAAPGCITTDKGTKDVKYRIHFQNEGDGEAHNLKIEALFDKRLKASIGRLTKDSLNIIVANKQLQEAIEVIGFTKTDSTFYFTIKMDGQDKKKTLSNNKVPMWFCNPLTMGDVYFTLKVPIDTVADYLSYANITFYDSKDTGMIPVRTLTDTLHVRDTCTGMVHPRIAPLSDSTKDPKTCTNCNPNYCKKLGGLCWYWWIVIGIGLLAIIWLLAKRRKKGKEEYKA